MLFFFFLYLCQSRIFRQRLELVRLTEVTAFVPEYAGQPVSFFFYGEMSLFSHAVRGVGRNLSRWAI